MFVGSDTPPRDLPAAAESASPTPNWRTRLLEWSLRTAVALATIAFPLFARLAITRMHPGWLTYLATVYVLLVAATVLRRHSYTLRALTLLIGLGSVAVLGYYRVGFQVGPGIGSALTVVLAGLLLGRVALAITFAITLAAIPAMGAYTIDTGGYYMADWTNDPLRFDNWLRATSAYALFTGVLVATVTFVVANIERALADRTQALERWQAAQAQHREAEDALDHAQRTILQMQKLEAVGRLAGGVAHDFNNALVVILGWADLLRSKPVDAARLRSGLDEIVNAGNRAAGLTQQLLAFARKGVHVPRVVTPATVVDEVARMLRRLLPASIHLETHVAPDVRAVMVDATQIHQVLLNLCLNARDAMPEGGTLEISAQNHAGDGSADSPEGDWVLLRVRDTGVGMDAATRARAFEPFFTTKGELGSGLGLASVYGIVHQSGGEVRIESELGRGTQVDVLLAPCAAVPDEPSTKASTSLQCAPATILIAEDETAVRNLMVSALQAAGHTVLAAEHGSAALDLARRYRGRIDLLCTDGVMPGISSPTLIADFRLLFPRARVLLCSGHIDQRLQDELQRAELEYLHKPFTGDSLTRVVAELLMDQSQRTA
jgi:signal transduction histidine kinase